MKTLITSLLILCMFTLQAQDITIIDTAETYTPQRIVVEGLENCNLYFETGTDDNYETMYIKGYSNTKECFYIKVDCNGYIIEVDGLRHKTEVIE